MIGELFQDEEMFLILARSSVFSLPPIMLLAPLNPAISFPISLILALSDGDYFQLLGPEVVTTSTAWVVRGREVSDYTAKGEEKMCS